MDFFKRHWFYMALMFLFALGMSISAITKDHIFMTAAAVFDLAAIIEYAS